MAAPSISKRRFDVVIVGAGGSGMQVVIEDYVHNERIKLACVMANNFFCIAVALASIYAILKMSSGV